MERVVVTGIGAVTPLAGSFAGSWRAVRDRRTGIGPISRFDASSLPWKTAGEIRDFAPDRVMTQKEQRRLDRFAQYAVVSASEALASAGLAPGSPLIENAGVVIGSSRGGIGLIEQAWSGQCGERTGSRRLAPSLMPATTIGMAASAVSRFAGIRGTCLGISNACASGSIALGEAFRMLRAGHEGPVIAGGTDAPVTRICLEGYGAAGALSKQSDASASRPFAVGRDGFVLSEGACLFVLERLQDALSRRAPVFGEIIGYGNTSDAGHPTQPSLEGESRTMRAAISSACLDADAIDVVFSHGTSTLLGDRIEAGAIRSSFGKRADSLPVTAIKSMTGHMLAGSGPFEAACALMGMLEGVIPATTHLDRQDPECRINVVREPLQGDFRTGLVNSFGFGGTNAVLVLRKLTD